MYDSVPVHVSKLIYLKLFSFLPENSILFIFYKKFEIKKLNKFEVKISYSNWDYLFSSKLLFEFQLV